MKGKYAYMAPEQARGEPVSRLSDTYAAAIIFWELLTGERLFAGKTEAETVHKCLVARVRPPGQLAPDVDPALDAILLTALSRDAASRYPTAREMALAIEAVVPAVRPSEVGAWVEGLAGEALAARAGIQAEIEGSAPSPGAIRVTMREELAPDEREASAAVMSTRTPERTGTGKAKASAAGRRGGDPGRRRGRRHRDGSHASPRRTPTEHSGGSPTQRAHAIGRSPGCPSLPFAGTLRHRRCPGDRGPRVFGGCLLLFSCPPLAPHLVSAPRPLPGTRELQSPLLGRLGGSGDLQARGM